MLISLWTSGPTPISIDPQHSALIDGFEDNALYIGQTAGDVATRVAQHLSQEGTVKRYMRKNKINSFRVVTLFEYKHNYKDIEERLYEKESKYMKDFADCGYKLINISKMKSLGIDK